MGTLIGSKFLDQKAANFNGTDELVYRDDPSFKGDTAGAWSFWLKLDSLFTGTATQIVICLGVRDAGNDSTFIIGPRRIVTTGANTYMSLLHRATNGGITSSFSATTTAFAAGAWTHVVVQSNGGAWSMYINGVAQTMTNWLGTGSNNGDWYGDISGSDHRFTIGTNYRNNAVQTAYYAGMLDEVVYLNGRAFTAPEITEIYNAGVPKNPHRLSMVSDLETWWRFGDSRDDATTIYDEVSSNNLTLVNMDASNYVTP